MVDYHEEPKLFKAFGPLERRKKDKTYAVRLGKPSQKI
jgi:hypothetical protein